MLNKINNVLKGAEIVLGMVLLFALLVLITLNIFFRYFLNAPISWSNELNSFLLIWVGFLSTAYTVSESNHISVASLKGLFPKAYQISLDIVFNLMLIAMLVYLMKPVIEVFDFLRNPMFITIFSGKHFFMIIPISYTLMIFHLIINTKNSLHDLLHTLKKKEVI
jgi:TRAP-type C4-dicarboxylate transport system permease small subunit